MLELWSFHSTYISCTLYKNQIYLKALKLYLPDLFAFFLTKYFFKTFLREVLNNKKCNKLLMKEVPSTIKFSFRQVANWISGGTGVGCLGQSPIQTRPLDQ